MTGLRTDGRTYVRTYGHDVITKFSELHGLLPFSLTNGCSASGLRPLELRYNSTVKRQKYNSEWCSDTSSNALLRTLFAKKSVLLRQLLISIKLLKYV